MSVSWSYIQYPAGQHQPSFCSSGNLNLTPPHQPLQHLWHHPPHLVSLSQHQIHLSLRLKPCWMEVPGILLLRRCPLLHWWYACPARCHSQSLHDEKEEDSYKSRKTRYYSWGKPLVPKLVLTRDEVHCLWFSKRVTARSKGQSSQCCM